MNNETIYIVTSLHRSGSSMMMRCLEAGGMEVVCDKNIDNQLNTDFGSDDYIPNPNGYYQAPDNIFEDENLVENLQGKVVKIYLDYLCKLPIANYKIIFMRRDKKEILASMAKMSGGEPLGYEQDNVENDVVFIAEKKALFSERHDFQFIEVDYATLVKNPQESFSKIKDFGFPIDIEIASSMVEPSLHRFKLENL